MHIIVGTPGRLSDLIKKQKINLNMLDLLVLDEADRLLDAVFEEGLIEIFGAMEVNRDFFKENIHKISQRQEDK